MPAPTWICSWARTPGPARTARRPIAERVRRAGHPDGAAGHADRLADRPGELAGLGPVDPWLARDLANAAAASPRTTWCVTVTDGQGHAIGHGCARPEPKRHRKRAGPGTRDGPGFSFAPAAEPGTWRLRVPGTGPDLLVRFDPVDTERCDHRFQAKGHDPGVKLRHLTQVGTRPAPGPGAAGPPPPLTSSTTSRTRRAAGRACATRARSAGAITGSSRTRAGTWTSFPTGRSAGRPRPDGSTPPSRRGTRSRRTGGRLGGWHCSA